MNVKMVEGWLWFGLGSPQGDVVLENVAVKNTESNILSLFAPQQTLPDLNSQTQNLWRSRIVYNNLSFVQKFAPWQRDVTAGRCKNI